MLSLTDEQRMVVDALSQLVEREFSENAFQWNGEFPWANIESLAEHGFLGINLSEEYGGGGMGELEAVLATEIIGRVCPDTAYAYYNNSMVSPRAIEMFGTDEAKEHYLPPVCAGETTIAIAISEPHAGSDAGAMNTHIEEDGGELFLSGEKIWVSNVPDSAAAVVWTKFPDGTLGTVVMDFDAAGVDVGEHYTNMAGHTQTHFFMEDVHIPEENVLVRGRAALKEQLKALNWERVGSSTYANAMALCAIDQALDYAQEREQFGSPLAEFQGMRWKLAEATTQLQASRALTYAAARSGEATGYPDRLTTTVAKLFSSRTVEEVVSESLQVFGATGYQQEHPLEYLYRLQRGRRIAAGTDEVMLNNIADVVFSDGLGGFGN